MDRDADDEGRSAAATAALTEKYNTLLQAYKKQRAENSVLKKAIVAEQEKVCLRCPCAALVRQRRLLRGRLPMQRR